MPKTEALEKLLKTIEKTDKLLGQKKTYTINLDDFIPDSNEVHTDIETKKLLEELEAQKKEISSIKGKLQEDNEILRAIILSEVPTMIPEINKHLHSPIEFSSEFYKLTRLLVLKQIDCTFLQTFKK